MICAFTVGLHGSLYDEDGLVVTYLIQFFKNMLLIIALYDNNNENYDI